MQPAAGIASNVKMTDTPYTFEEDLSKECNRLFDAIRVLPELLCSQTPVTLHDFEEKTGLSRIELLVGGWEKVIDHINEAIRCKNENLLLTKQFDNLREAIYTAVEQALRPIRDNRVSEIFFDSETPL